MHNFVVKGSLLPSFFVPAPTPIYYVNFLIPVDNDCDEHYLVSVTIVCRSYGAVFNKWCNYKLQLLNLQVRNLTDVLIW